MIESFLEYMRVEQRASRHTIEAYGRDLRQFEEWLGADFGKDPAAVTPADIRGWIGSLADDGRTATTLRRKAQSLRAFFHRAHAEGRISSNPASEVVLPKKRKHLPNFIKESEIETLLDNPGEGFGAARTHIALTLLYSLGLRQAELLSLTDVDVNHVAKEIRVTGKRNKQRVVPMPDLLSDEIRSWQALRDEHYPDLPNPRPILAGPHGAISKGTLYAMVREGLSGISAGRKSPHTLRHTFATAMVNHGADLDAVREMLGHASLATTQIYTHLSVNELMADYRKAHPRGENQKNHEQG